MRWIEKHSLPDNVNRPDSVVVAQYHQLLGEKTFARRCESEVQSHFASSFEVKQDRLDSEIRETEFIVRLHIL